MKLDPAVWESALDWTDADARHDLPSDEAIRDYVVAALPFAEESLRYALTMSITGTRQVARALGVSMACSSSLLTTPYGVPVEVSTVIPLSKANIYTIPELRIVPGLNRDPGLARVLVVYLEAKVDPSVVGWVWNHVLEAQGKRHYASGGPNRFQAISFAPSRLRPISELAVANPWQPRGTQVVMFE
jgi:hypothetical protein